MLRGPVEEDSVLRGPSQAESVLRWLPRCPRTSAGRGGAGPNGCLPGCPGKNPASLVPPWCLASCPMSPFLPPWCLSGCPNGPFLPPWCLPVQGNPVSGFLKASLCCGQPTVEPTPGSAAKKRPFVIDDMMNEPSPERLVGSIDTDSFVINGNALL